MIGADQASTGGRHGSMISEAGRRSNRLSMAGALDGRGADPYGPGMAKNIGALEAFRLYTQAFQSLDARAVAAHYHEPAMIITPQGVVPFPTGAAVEEFYGKLMADLPARGYARTELSGLAERPLAAGLGLVTGVGVWRKASGEEIQRFGMTFTLRRSGESWRIVVATIHDADTR
jgi:ketosteroid isomerase-like protein